MPNYYPRLVADIGGTNARFAIEKTPFELSHIDTLACADYDSFLLAIYAYLKKHQLTLPQYLGIAIANPITGDIIQMTNHHWRFSITELKSQLSVEKLLFINDFTAQALAITQMDETHITQISGEQSAKITPSDRPAAVIGAGTGLGVSGLIPDGRGAMVALAGEGGHVTFSPANQQQNKLLLFAEKKWDGHVSAERLLQGNGLVLIYQFLADEKGLPLSRHVPADITRGALVEKDALCIQVLSLYCEILGSFCADVVLTIGATGGVYLAGGVVPRFVDFLKQSHFRQQFENKGRLQSYLKEVAVYVVEHPNPGLLGAAVALNKQLS